MIMREEIKEKPNLSIIALTSFIVSFLIARTFTTLNPNIVLVGGGYHIHHFWYGIALLAVGGWLGINYQSERIDRLAAILFGAGGGLIGDEVGILLTLSAHAYWADITYTFIITFLIIVSMALLISKYRKAIQTEFSHFLRSNASLYIGVFMAAISTAFILETDNIVIITVSGISSIIAFILVLSYFIQQIKMRKREGKTSLKARIIRCLEVKHVGCEASC
ncbi:MAG: hypothetical protein QXV21_06150 [Candidatus Bathyarchaeia archaeon]